MLLHDEDQHTKPILNISKPYLYLPNLKKSMNEIYLA